MSLFLYSLILNIFSIDAYATSKLACITDRAHAVLEAVSQSLHAGRQGDRLRRGPMKEVRKILKNTRSRNGTRLRLVRITFEDGSTRVVYATSFRDGAPHLFVPQERASRRSDAVLGTDPIDIGSIVSVEPAGVNIRGRSFTEREINRTRGFQVKVRGDTPQEVSIDSIGLNSEGEITSIVVGYEDGTQRQQIHLNAENVERFKEFITANSDDARLVAARPSRGQAPLIQERPPSIPPPTPRSASRTPSPQPEVIIPESDDAIGFSSFVRDFPPNTEAMAVLRNGQTVPVRIVEGGFLERTDLPQMSGAPSLRRAVAQPNPMLFDTHVAAIRLGTEELPQTPEFISARMRYLLQNNSSQPSSSSRLVQVTLRDGSTKIVQIVTNQGEPVLVTASQQGRPIRGHAMFGTQLPQSVPLDQVSSIRPADILVSGQPMSEASIRSTDGFFIVATRDPVEISIDDIGVDDAGNITSVTASFTSESGTRHQRRLNPEDLERFKRFITAEPSSRSQSARPRN